MNLTKLTMDEWERFLMDEYLMYLSGIYDGQNHSVTEEEYKEFLKWSKLSYDALIECEHRLDRLRSGGLML